jgi:hypothetical protein
MHAQVDDARRMAEMCERTTISDDDVRFALEHNPATTSAAPVALLHQLSAHVNATPLTEAAAAGLRLPPERHCLLQRNAQLSARADLLQLVQTSRQQHAAALQSSECAHRVHLTC